jgi:hypothetical protein
MKSKFAVLFLLLMSSFSFAATTDFQVDSKYTGIHGTPFKLGHNVPLPPAFAAVLKNLLLHCVVDVQSFDKGYETDFGPKVLPYCSKIIQTRYDQRAFSELAQLNVGGTWIVAKTFDGLDSDGGDQFDIAVYDVQGNRRAVATSIYAETSALYGLARLVGIKAYPVMSKHSYDILPRY